MDGKGITPTFIFQRESALKCLDAEVGGGIGSGSFCCDCISWTSYFALGGYYLKPMCGGGRLGGKFRWDLTIANSYFFELRGHYDHVKSGALQFMVGINFDFSPSSSISNCEAQLKRRITQPVERADIIPLRRYDE